MISGIQPGLQPPLEGMWFYLLGVVAVGLVVGVIIKYLEIISDLFDWKGK
jgi:hypothetical protein